MKSSIQIKAAFLILALVGVFYLMRTVTPDRIANFFGAVGAMDQHEFKLCETRVQALIFADGRKVAEEQKGLSAKWLAYDPDPREINYLEIERWLGKYCELDVIPVAASEAGTFQSAMVVEFINGSRKAIAVATDGASGAVFSAGDQVFRSPQFEEALSELKRLAQF